MTVLTYSAGNVVVASFFFVRCISRDFGECKKHAYSTSHLLSHALVYKRRCAQPLIWLISLSPCLSGTAARRGDKFGPESAKVNTIQGRLGTLPGVVDTLPAARRGSCSCFPSFSPSPFIRFRGWQFQDHRANNYRATTLNLPAVS